MKKLLSAEEIRAWDQFTILQEPVRSIDLMERAARQCVAWLDEIDLREKSLHIFCGKGNNGGDGLAIARMLAQKNIPVNVDILEFGHKGTEDFQVNLARLHQYPEIPIRFIQTNDQFREIPKDEIIIDALFGSGLNRGLEGVTAELVKHINNSGQRIISIDIPSGLFTDRSSINQVVIEANDTLTFQSLKKAFLVAENSRFIGNVHLLDIGLHPGFEPAGNGEFLLDEEAVRLSYKRRNGFSHKGSFGHALIVAGSYGKIGAAVLAATAALKSGAGLVTCHIPKCGYDIVQTSIPEAMVMTDFNSSIITKLDEDLSKFKAIGFGPGIGTASETRQMMKELLVKFQRPLVLDADALNIIATEKEMNDLIPKNSILTPHPREFERLFGVSKNDFERIEMAKESAKKLQVIIILKGHRSLIAMPDGTACFNTTGNPGMATAGTGDVLTGILTGLLAQEYDPVVTAQLGVYLHGLAGDIAAYHDSMESILAGSITARLGDAFRSISGHPNELPSKN